MSPMCLLNMPAEALQAAMRHAHQSSPHGERLERLRTQQILLMMTLTILPAAGLRPALNPC